MHLIAYTSEYTGCLADIRTSLNDIVEVSRRNNLAAGVTGVMFQHGLRFLQFLEGEEETVRNLLARISADHRHTNVVVLFDEPIDERGFAAWSMDCFVISSDTDLTLEFLQLVSSTYRRNLKTQTASVVEIFKGFVQDHAQISRL